MNFSGTPNNVIINNILSGFYFQNLNRGSVPNLFEFSSPSYPISNFQAPYDARLDIYTGDPANHLISVGRKIPNPNSPSFSSNVSGVLYYYENGDIYGTCHGFGRDSLTYYQGFNFYNAHYAPGYFSPPFGENISISKYNYDGATTLLEGVCSSLSYTEYNEIYGINSVVSDNANLTANDLNAGQLALLATPKAACPEVAISDFFTEVQLHPIQGTTSELGANNLFNSNPIPTSLDNYEIRVNTRYSIFTSGDETYVNYVSGRPVASYSPNSQQNKLNNTLCLAEIIETDMSFGAGTNGIQLLIAPDIEGSAVGSQASFIGVEDPWNLWQFNFRENSESFPFQDDFTPVSQGPIHQIGGQEGTQIFDYTLALEDNYWQNRQCPSTVDYLPWTFGASILACPSYYFDIPYYSAINKFGFYGMRFLNNCASLNLDNKWNGVPNASEMPASLVPYPIGDSTVLEPEGIDANGGGGFAQYDNLLAVAKSESSYSDMYALNKGFFIWSNDIFIQNTNQFNQLATSYPSFPYIYNGLVGQFNALLSGGITGYSQFQPNLLSQNNNGVITTSWAGDVLLTNNTYLDFYQQLSTTLNPQDLQLWTQIEDQYAYYITDGQGNVNEQFYQNIITGRDARMLTRYFENVVHGKPIDLFPLNKVTFSYDKAQDYLEHTGWNRSTSSFGSNSVIPDVQRRFFVGAYANGQNFSGVINVLNQLSLINGSYFYPGFFNDINISKDSPTPHYESVNSGIIIDQYNRTYSPSGWLALGYAGIGQLDGNFSCFTPIFVQQPIDSIWCKIGQAPTLRSLAVDYHTIPEDKISVRYPEIVYWTQKLKIIDNQFNNLYPLNYQWYRVPTSQYNNFIKYGDFSLTSMASDTGYWGCMEGNNNPNCTVINPLECVPNGTLGSFDSYTFVKGVTKGIDDTYNYFCLVSGRFGIRISEPSTINIENWTAFDVSFKNAVNTNTQLNIEFKINDYFGNTKIINFPSMSAPAYNGYQRDEYAVVEAQVTQKIPPPNAGYGDVSAVTPVGPIKYIGALRSYTPSFLDDTRGLMETWGKFIDYGTLVHFEKTLSQLEGDLLYGYSHLPVCTNYQMNNGQAGVQINPTLNGYNILHWTLNQKAVASFQQTWVGVPWQQLNTFGALYPPILNKDEDYQTVGVGQWQWYNNLGAIKRFGYLSDATTNDIVMIGNGSPSILDTAGYNTQIAAIKKLLIKPTYLAGTNCGYIPYGLGHNMIFYIEAFDRFYLYCDPLKKKNVQDLNYMNPGIRMGNSAIQYSFLGQPNNTYLERRAMYGPYAYQWRVRKHNRDRNGNGISQGFYSMGYGSEYSEMYDAPAIYGLYPKMQNSQSYIAQLTKLATLRQAVGFNNPIGLRGNYFGTTNGEGTASNYGNIFVDCTNDNPMCDYYSAFTSLAGQPDFENYACTPALIAQGACFDPCISIRYSQGFFPGGKAQNLFGVGSLNQSIRLVSSANNIGGNPILVDEQSHLDPTVYFRSPLNTPHAKISRMNGNTVVGISACKDGGSDHCNYTTPTVHLGTSSFLQGPTSSFLSLVNLMESIVGNYS